MSRNSFHNLRTPNRDETMRENHQHLTSGSIALGKMASTDCIPVVGKQRLVRRESDEEAREDREGNESGDLYHHED